jgi:hypothetical protein
MGVAVVPAIGLAIAAIGAGTSAYSAVASGNAQRQAAAYQAQVTANQAEVAGMNANAAIQTGNTQLQAAQEQAAQHQGMIRAVVGAGGLDLNSGSALRDQQGEAEIDQLNQATITSNAARSAWNYRNQGADLTAQAGLETMQGEQAQSAGYLSGFSSLLSGAGQFAGGWAKAFPSATS